MRARTPRGFCSRLESRPGERLRPPHNASLRHTRAVSQTDRSRPYSAIDATCSSEPFVSQRIAGKTRMSPRMKRLKLATWLALLLLVEPVPARPDLIFKVPEVLVTHAAAPRPVGTRPTHGETPSNTSDADELAQPTYYLEHEITIADARKAAQKMKLNEVADTLPGCGQCSRQAMEYCESSALEDHCCCERRYQPEPFPWMPHKCFIGAERCLPHAPNCAQYARIRDCCCNKIMATKWKNILSNASQLTASSLFLVVLALVLFSMYI